MTQAADWATYMSARTGALSGFADQGFVASEVDRAGARLQRFLGHASHEARLQARRCLLHTADAVFHDELLASGGIGQLHAFVAQVEVADRRALCESVRGCVAVSIHYGPATSVLPLWLAMASASRMIGPLGVIRNSRHDPNVGLSAKRHAELCAGGFPFTDLDIAQLGELGALRRALGILNGAGTVLIFADGQLPQPRERRTITCRLGDGLLALAEGPAWLARSAGVALQPLLIRPKGDTHQVVSIPAAAGGTASIQRLLDAAMGFDPAPWSCWYSGADHF
jgi:hypothetical protein